MHFKIYSINVINDFLFIKSILNYWQYTLDVDFTNFKILDCKVFAYFTKVEHFLT